MKLFKAAMTLCCTAQIGAMLAPDARADNWDKKTSVTFSGPVEIPGVHLAGWSVLPAGTYVFKMLDSQSDRHIVQIFSHDEKTIYATILAIPNYRLRATDKTVMTFSERAAGQPEALRAWFYPGRTSGEEFVYPKPKAMELAKASKTAVLFTSAEIPAEVAEPVQSVDAPVVVELKRAPVMAVKPDGEEVQIAQVVTPPPAAEAPAAQPQMAQVIEAPRPVPQPEVLPSTAGTLPMAGMLGLLLIGGSFALKAVRSRLL